MCNVAHLRGWCKGKLENGDLDLLGKEFRMKIGIEFCSGLTTVEEGRVMSGNKSCSCCVPLRFVPLMIRNLTPILLHNLVHARDCFDPTDGFVSKDGV
jgi:hypothetical protein